MAKRSSSSMRLADTGVRRATTPVKPVANTPLRLDRLIHERLRLGIVSALAVNERLTFYELKKLLQKAGLPDVRFHDLRHSVATMLLSMGTHPKVVQELLGHSQISMTMDIYSHVLPTMQRDAISKLNDALRKQDNGAEQSQ